MNLDSQEIVNQFGLLKNILGLAINILNDIVIKEIPAGKNPMAVAASVLYICCKKFGHPATQHTIAKADGISGISEVTLRNGLTEFERKKVAYFN